MREQGSDLILERMMALHPKIIDLTLDRVWRLLEALGNPQNNLPPVIHIAGTNGKGSSLAMIRAGLEGAGLRAHAYTSPHLVRFHERIRLKGCLITEDHLTEVLDECYEANGDNAITYFEITTCAALLAMSREPADYTLLEVGLGGRLDATNVVEKPALCVITPIDLDHQQFLGDTIKDIAGEKAGIIKRGVPVIVGKQTEAAMDVIEAQAARLDAPLHAYGQHWHIAREHDRLAFQDDNGLLDLPKPQLAGSHQIDNAGIAIAALRTLSAGDPESALTSAQWPARMQRLREGALIALAPGAEIWLDGGHNPAAGRAIATHIKSLPQRDTFIICGMLNTKDISGFLKPLADVSNTLFALSIPNEANTLPASETAQAARACGFHSQEADTAQEAVIKITQDYPNARVLICGSLYLAGAILRENS